uniref:Uncharacterized protein n=1 Tax=Fagus sylvatica TaxID=28930 RepID=A0A2N9FRN6_FAGSY
MENDKTEIKKEKKREKKEKKDKKDKNEKKEKRNARKRKENPSDIDCKITNGKITKINNEKYGQLAQSKAESLGVHLQKRIDDETEPLEKSGLSEEHGQPVCSPNVSYLSDSTQRSNKRKRDTSPSSETCSHGGTILRFRLPLKKHKAPEPLKKLREPEPLKKLREPEPLKKLKETEPLKTLSEPEPLKRLREPEPLKMLREPEPLKTLREPDASLSNEQLCSTSGRVGFSAHQKDEILHVPSQGKCHSPNATKSIVAEEPASRPEKEVPCPLPRKIKLTKHEKKIQKTESLYKSLIENFVLPPPHYQGDNFGDEEWLYSTKHEEDTNGSKRFKACNDVSSCRSPTLWQQHAQYLPEADIYALPYSVPF